jgi:hypothetical protein
MKQETQSQQHNYLLKYIVQTVDTTKIDECNYEKEISNLAFASTFEDSR